MLERLQIEGFQKHAKLRLQLDPGITTLVGHTDAGKSSILRALQWALTNQPDGDAFITHGAKGARVVLWLDGHKITRTRGGTTNTYGLDTATYKALVRGIAPAPVAAVANVQDVNFQAQDEPAYWFHDSPATVSRNLNSIINLEVMDTCMAALGAETRKAKAELEVIETRLAEAKKERQRHVYWRAMDDELCNVEVWETEAHTKATQAAVVAALIAQATTHQTTRDKATAQAQAARAVLKLGRVAHNAAKRATALAGLVATARQSIKRPPPTKHLIKLHAKATDASKAAETVGVLVHTARNNAALLEVFNIANGHAQKALGSVCPVCQRPFQ